MEETKHKSKKRLFLYISLASLLSLLSFLIYPIIIREILDYLLFPYNVNLLWVCVLIGIFFLLFDVMYHFGIHTKRITPIKAISHLFHHWQSFSIGAVIICWEFFFLGFSPSAFWLREYNFWLIVFSFLILGFIVIRLTFLRFLDINLGNISRVYLLVPFVIIALISVASIPYLQIYAVIPSTSSSEILEFNSNSTLIPLDVSYSWDVFLNDYSFSSFDSIQIQKNIQYNDYSSLDVYYTLHTTQKNPLLIVIHGGGWFSGSKNDKPIQFVSRFFVAHGFTVFAINYRLFPSANIFEMVTDVRDAVVYAKSNAFHYNGNSNVTFLFGRSAGAHLGLLAAYSSNRTLVPEYPSIYTVPELEIQGVASMYGITELGTDSARLAGTDENQESFPIQSVSPLNYVNNSNLTPTFLAAGSLDSLVSVKNSRLLHEALNKYNITNLYLEIPWANHAFDNILQTPAGQVTMYYLLNFFSHYSK